ncbi:EfeM/EfeO family lipoprotein [Actinoallomurus purpureus]|uniref:iron uptake system protein EfeO n=1 Tax=Actinoallomurus purpureus TaxID=478114 RepID=UPI0020937B3C|nr:iron uptake system protein EfeO [Actinoallomurus purpureus]MCO6006267.1 EfeM/EfeO family lipoprotein [Actinoallomurus purpureus]
MRPVHLLAAASAALVSVSALSACGKDDKAGAKGGAGAIEVTATDSSCDLGTKSTSAGAVTFKVTNKGSQVNELEILAPDGKIVSERENIGPGTGAEVTVQLSAGTYKVMCSAGMTGKGPSQALTVTGQGKATDPRLDQAVAAYRTYVADQVADTLDKATKFAAAVKAGDVEQAKALYAPSRVGWESIEPVAESFGDIDPKVDLREADLKPGDKWTGWHRIEKALWKTGSIKDEGPYADQLVKDLQTLKAKVGTASITATSMANGAKELLDEVATGKVTGEEETFSHTDLVDFKANVDGAQKVYELLKPVVQERNADLAATLDDEFAKVQKLLTKYQKGDGYVAYDTVGAKDRKDLSNEVNALGEPLSKLAGVVAR